MSRATYALIAIRLDARDGLWVTIEDLAVHLGLSCVAVRSACELMRADGLLEARRASAGHIDAVRTPAMLHAEAA
jgi:DNA-binding IscR family transcriptional regulator